MNRTEAHLVLGTVANARALSLQDLRDAREAGIPEDGIYHLALQTQTYLASEEGLPLRETTPNQGRCKGACVQYGCPPARIMQCNDRFIPKPTKKKKRA